MDRVGYLGPALALFNPAPGPLGSGCAQPRRQIRVTKASLRIDRHGVPPFRAIERLLGGELLLEDREIGLRRVAALPCALQDPPAQLGRRAVQSRITKRAALAAATCRNSSRSLRRRNVASTMAL